MLSSHISWYVDAPPHKLWLCVLGMQVHNDDDSVLCENRGVWKQRLGAKHQNIHE